MTTIGIATLDEIGQRYASRPGDVERLLAVARAALALVAEWEEIPYAPRASGEFAAELHEAVCGALLGMSDTPATAEQAEPGASRP